VVFLGPKNIAFCFFVFVFPGFKGTEDPKASGGEREKNKVFFFFRTSKSALLTPQSPPFAYHSRSFSFCHTTPHTPTAPSSKEEGGKGGGGGGRRGEGGGGVRGG